MQSNIHSKVNYLYQDIVHFKGLNTLRFIAAFIVVLQHSESMKLKNGLPYLGTISLFHSGSYAVTFFFVLSGFLITYFLLKEKKKSKTIRVKNFYTKRVLRIFPLYFLLVILGSLVLPFLITYFGIDYEIPYTFRQTWYFYLFFVPCLVTFYYGHHLLEPLWSIGVEMFFYMIWPPLLKMVKKNILALLLSVIGIRIILLLSPYFLPVSEVYKFLITTYSIEAMAIGGLGAYFIFHLNKEISSLFIFRRTFQYSIFIILIVFVFFNKNIDNPLWKCIFGTPILSSLLLDFLFLYIIITISLAKNSFIKVENKILCYFGDISYGIYMYHTSVIAVVILFFKKLHFSFNAVITNALFYCIVISATLLVSYLSNKYFENYFLTLRKRKVE